MIFFMVFAGNLSVWDFIFHVKNFGGNSSQVEVTSCLIIILAVGQITSIILPLSALSLSVSRKTLEIVVK